MHSVQRSAYSVQNVKTVKNLGLYLVACILCLATGCTNDMKDQPKFEAYEETSFFPDHRSQRPLIDGVVARGHLNEDEGFYTGKSEGKLLKKIPVPVTKKLLERGRERFNIYCIVCHGAVGAGDGIVIRRGFKPIPTNFHSDKLRQIEDGHFFDVISHGFGVMQDYSMQIEPADRWAITAYIRALQLSQNAKISQLTETDKQKLTEKPEPVQEHQEKHA